jgi:hypothetical protein
MKMPAWRAHSAGARPRRRSGSGRLVKLAAIALAAGAAAAGLGVAVASLTNESPLRSGAVATLAARRATALDISIVAAVLHPAASERGQLRRRARQSVELLVTNNAGAIVKLARPTLESGGKSVAADIHARDEAHGLFGPLLGGSTVRGVLRFGTAGDLSDRLRQTRRATLHIGGRSFDLRVKLGGPAA